MSTLDHVTHHLDDPEVDSMANTLLLLGAKHATIVGFDPLWLVYV